ncbi:hypothetical protein LTR37_020724 [Vermiconidia calcicola]|uniref:Uncharacterized protein n=1 Tax=Vermiconidia calcicola TaxID=1690605 RepID=A0ACC3MAH2_9PEZI|nr:hypothetical protein LTR37_020724 [Vermiconidia calcicola]
MASGVSKLIPSDPDKVMVIRRLTPNLMTCSTPFLRFGRVKIGGRGTIVKLADGNLAVFSPTALTDNVKKQMQQQLASTKVKYLTALDQEHHIFLESWHKAWPNARIIVPETLPGYRDKQGYFKLPQSNLVTFKKDTPSSWTVDAAFDAEFNREYNSAHGNQELVFCHKPTRTLIEADLLFNLPANEQFSRTDTPATSGYATRLANSINGTTGTALSQKRFIWYTISAGDRKGFNASVARVAKWDFERIVPCHGDVIEAGGKGVFEKVMAWHLEAAKAGN